MAKTQLQETFPKIYKDKENIFTIVEMKKNQFRIALGNEIVVEKTFKTKNEAQDHINEKNWEMMLNVLCVATKKVIEQLKQQENEKTK